MFRSFFNAIITAMSAAALYLVGEATGLTWWVVGGVWSTWMRISFEVINFMLQFTISKPGGIEADPTPANLYIDWTSYTQTMAAMNQYVALDWALTLLIGYVGIEFHLLTWRLLWRK